MRFYYIYKALAHPEQNGYVAPYTLEERLAHIREARQKLGTKIPWLCDTMKNDLKHALGDRPNSEFVVDPNGKIVVARQWSDPEALRADLEELVGRPSRRTTVAEVGIKPVTTPHAAPTGIVERLRLPSGMQPVIVSPVESEQNEPYYIKLRAEVEPEYFESGSGRLYLGFFPDPLYRVHWNNQTPPPVFRIVQTTGVVVAPDTGTGPRVSAAADADPREFLVDVCDDGVTARGANAHELIVELRYVACDDDQTFCKPVTQRYRVVLQRDPDGGSRRSSRQRPGSGRGNPGNLPPSARGAMQRRLQQMSDAERREFMRRQLKSRRPRGR